jgi:hypothetical protein
MEEVSEVKPKKYYTEAVKKAVYKYRANNKGCQTETTKKWQKNNPEKVKEYMKEYYEKNKEKILAKCREKYREKTKEKNLEKLISLLK